MPWPPPPPLSSPPPPPEMVKDSSTEPEDSVGQDGSKMLSSWFPSVPASDCEGIFEFTVEGTTNLPAKNLESGNHKITIKLTSASPGSIDGQFWVDKKSNNDKGSTFDIEKTFNNCRVVTASSVPSSVGQQGSSPSSLLNSLLNDISEEDISEEDYSEDEQLTNEIDNNGDNEAENKIDGQQVEENAEDVDRPDRDRKKEIAALE
jgi:hypothetical protein